MTQMWPIGAMFHMFGWVLTSVRRDSVPTKVGWELSPEDGVGYRCFEADGAPLLPDLRWAIVSVIVQLCLNIYWNDKTNANLIELSYPPLVKHDPDLQLKSALICRRIILIYHSNRILGINIKMFHLVWNYIVHHSAPSVTFLILTDMFWLNF